MPKRKIPLLFGGQLQRVAIARCLIANPSMMFLDEPFGALDANTRMKMQFFLLEIFRKSSLLNLNPTIVLVTHDPREAVLLGEDIFILGPGGVIAQHIKPIKQIIDKFKQENKFENDDHAYNFLIKQEIIIDTNLKNGIVLCRECHKKEHINMGSHFPKTLNDII